MYICRAGIFPSGETAHVRSMSHPVAHCRPKALLPEFSAHGVHLKEKHPAKERRTRRFAASEEGYFL